MSVVEKSVKNYLDWSISLCVAETAGAPRQRLGADVREGAGGVRAHHAGRVARDGRRDTEVDQLQLAAH